MAKEQGSEIMTGIAGADLNGNNIGTLLKRSAGKLILTAAATDIVAGILAEDLPTGTDTTDKAIAFWPVNKAHEAPVLMGAAAAVDRVLVPSATAGRAGSVANIGGLAVDQQGFGILMVASTANGQVRTAQIMPIGAPHSA